MYIQADANVGTMVATLYQESERGKQDIESSDKTHPILSLRSR
jgi:hypothetical protein